jgi:AcrR family transcriptional regulator
MYHQHVVTRRYQMKARAKQHDETRQRIVDATIELHQTIGPMVTTVSDVARQAEVGRVTVYRHFPDELSLARACSGHYLTQHPFPDLDHWQLITDPEQRLRTGLAEGYAYHRSTEAMMTRVLSQARDHEAVQPILAYWRQAAEVLTQPWRARGRGRETLHAAILLAVSFEAWRSLTQDSGLTDAEAAGVAQGLVAAQVSRRRSRTAAITSDSAA